ncbi:hypothetical protein PIB30_012891 [Stylosanthes scabra]|uniref:Uncharacterized protein n=1 Tax=Stylosanthes scabra TaxID=79078 RepID=A0ABU6X3K0_9FABA|nr:hypothetical protein [Stylosanthes scabra]
MQVCRGCPDNFVNSRTRQRCPKEVGMVVEPRKCCWGSGGRDLWQKVGRCSSSVTQHHVNEMWALGGLKASLTTASSNAEEDSGGSGLEGWGERGGRRGFWDEGLWLLQMGDEGLWA